MDSNASRTFSRFLLVGAAATGLQYALLIGLVDGLRQAPVPSSACAYAVSTLFGYVASHRYTYRSARAHRSALPRFLVISTLGLALNTAILSVTLSQAHVHYVVAQVVATLVTLFWNFMAGRLWAFAD